MPTKTYLLLPFQEQVLRGCDLRARQRQQGPFWFEDMGDEVTLLHLHWRCLCGFQVRLDELRLGKTKCRVVKIDVMSVEHMLLILLVVVTTIFVSM